MIKKTLGAVINKAAVHSISLGDFAQAFEVLEVAVTVLSSTTNSEECRAYLSSTYANLAYCWQRWYLCSFRDLGKALDYAEKALELSKGLRDPIGCALGRLAKSAILCESGAHSEAAAQAREATLHLDPLLTQQMKSQPDASLQQNQRFIDLLQLQLAALAREVTAVELAGGENASKAAEEKETQAYRLAQRFLPESNELVQRLSGKHRPEAPKPTVKVRKPRSHAAPSKSDSLNSRAEDEDLATVMKTEERTKAPVVEAKRLTQAQVQPIPESPSPDSPVDSTPPRVIRLPDDPGPCIPRRSRCNAHPIRFDFARDWERVDPSFLLDTKRKYVVMPDGMQVSQVVASDAGEYKITCGVVVRSGNTLLTIAGEGLERGESFATPESLQLSEFESILSLLNFKDVAPLSQNLKFINSFDRFAQYFLFPFLRIIPSSQRSAGNKIELWGQAAGLINAKVERVLFRDECRVTLHALSLTSLRLILSEAAVEEYKDECVRVDIDYDAGAQWILPKVKLVETDPGLLRKGLPTLTQVDVDFLHHLDPIITEIELLGKDIYGPDVSLHSFLTSEPFFVCKATVEGKNLRKTLWTLQENFRTKCWEVRGKTVYTSGDSSRSSEVLHSVSFTEVMCLFGVRVDMLEVGERRLVAKMYIDGLSIEADDSVGLHQSAAVVVSPLETVISRRYLLTKDGYKVPVTLSLVAFAGTLAGVKATVYDLHSGMDSGCFFPIDLRSFVHNSAQRYRTPTLTTSDSLYEYAATETTLVQLLEKNDGWKTIFNALQFKPFKKGLRVLITDRTGRTSLVDSLDNVLFRYK